MSMYYVPGPGDTYNGVESRYNPYYLEGKADKHSKANCSAKSSVRREAARMLRENRGGGPNSDLEGQGRPPQASDA